MLAAAAQPYEVPYDGPGLSGARTLPVAQLSVGYSPRETKVDTSHVAVLMEVLDLLPPVIIDQRTMTVIDGVHRLEAFRQAGRTHIEAVLFTGQRPEAMVLAIKANVKHGKPLSRGERREAARSLLHAFPERSDRWVAEVCGLSHTTVALVRRSDSLPHEKMRTGRDGRRRPVDRRAGQLAAARLIADHPATTVRQVAEAVGVAPSTVHRARARLQEPGRPPLPAPTLGRSHSYRGGRPRPGVTGHAGPGIAGHAGPGITGHAGPGIAGHAGNGRALFVVGQDRGQHRRPVHPARGSTAFAAVRRGRRMPQTCSNLVGNG